MGLDAVVVGAGPNGLAAAITLAREGCSTVVVEAAPTAGGGTRSAELTRPGFVNDVCSAIHPLALASPLFRELSLEEEGLEWVHPPIPLAHPLKGHSCATLRRFISAPDGASRGDSAHRDAGLGEDAEHYRDLMAPLARRWDEIVGDVLGPLRFPRHPRAALDFGRHAVRSASALARGHFRGDAARALLAGISAHSGIPLERSPSAAFGLLLALVGHALGWPIPRGGSQKIADALVSRLRSLGGEIVTGTRVSQMGDLPEARAYLFDVSPRALARIVPERLPVRYLRRLERYRYGPGVFKVDYALDAPVPWSAPASASAGTVHVGGSIEDIESAQRAAWLGAHPERPLVILAQPSLFDPTRAPAGKHTLWAYCHVPAGSTADCTELVERQIERFAPGFRERVLARASRSAADLEAYDSNYVGGDINCGVQDLRQLFTRPVARLVPYATPDPRIYICSSATPPGGGVHGMCGYFAARAALRFLDRTASSAPPTSPKSSRVISNI